MLRGFTIIRAHWIDVGGYSTGFGAGMAAADPWLEGLQLNQLKIYKAGVPNDWWCVDLCFWPDAWSVTADSKTFLDKMRKKYAA